MKGVFIPEMRKPLKCSGEVDSNGKPKPACPFYGTWACNITHGFVDEDGDPEKPCPLIELDVVEVVTKCSVTYERDDNAERARIPLIDIHEVTK